MNYTHYCLDQNNRLYFADRNYIGYSDNYQTELKKVKYDTAEDNLYYFGHYNNKLYMVKKYELYEIDPVTLDLTKIPQTGFIDWYGEGLMIIGRFLYFTTRYNAATSYHALDLESKTFYNVSSATYDLIKHIDSVKAVSFNGINKFASVYDSANRLYTPTIERYELNSKCELEKASVITAPFTVSRITKAFIYDDNHIGIYANGLIGIYNMHTGVKLHEITSTVQSSYVIYGLRSSSQDFITLIKESSSSIKLYSNTKLLKSHTSFIDFKRQNQVVTYMAYRADNAIQVVKVGIQKQSGLINLSFGERIYAHNKGLLPTKENTYGEEKALFTLNERVLARDSDAVPLKERIVETIHTKNLTLKGNVREPQNGELFVREAVYAKEKQPLEMKEHIDKLLPIIEKDLMAGITQMVYFDNTLYFVSNDVLYYTTDYKTFKKYGFPTGTSSYAIAASDNYLYIAHMLTGEGTKIYVRPKTGSGVPDLYKKIFTNLEPTKIMVTPDDSIIAVEDSRQELVLYVENFFSKTFAVSEERGANKGFGSLVGVEYAPNDDPLYPEYVYHMYLVKDGVLSGFEWDESYSARRIPERRLAYGTLSYVKLLKQHTIGYVANGTLYVKDYIKNKILYSIDGVSSEYGYKEVGADVYITVFAYGNFDLYKNGVRVHRIVAGFSGALKATCNSPQALMAAISDTQETKHKLYGFNLSLLSYTLPLQEEIIENNTIKLKGTVYASYLADLGLTEEVMSGLATLDLEEDVVDYTKAYATLALQEKALKPNQDLITLPLVERSCFKPGEWGTGKKNLWLKEKVVPVPYHSIWLKGEVINKPIATHALDLSLAENVWAYHTYLPQKEVALSDKVYWYYRDGILGEPVMIPEAKTAYITTEWSIAAHDYVVFEIDSHNPMIESVRFDSLDGLEFETIRNIKCDSYTLIDAYTGAKRQVYGFIAKAPFHCSHLRINNKGKSFNLLRLYDGYNPSMMGEHYLGLTEHIESQATTLPMGERVWLESDGERRSIYLTERIFPTAPEVLNLTLKEQIQGLDGEAVAKTKERVILPDTDTHSDLYYMEAEDRPKLQVHPVWNMPHIIKKSGCLLVKFERAKTDWEQNIYLKLSSTHALRTFSVVIGFYDEKINELAGIREIGYIDSYTNQYEAHVDVTRYIHNAIGQANLVTDKIAYIGIRGFFYDEQMSINSMEVVRIRGSITRDIFTKEFVMTSVRDSYTPELLRYRDNNGHDTYYTYNQVIKFVRDYNDRYITNVVAEMAKPVVPEHISIVASQPIGDLILYYKQKTMIKPAKVELIDNKYYHDFDLAGSENITDWMIMKFAGPEAEVVVYSINMYHNGFRDYKTLALQERIFPAPEKMVLSLREKVEYAPGITLTLKETADKLCVSARALGTKEYITTPEHTIAAALLNIKETAKPYTYSRGIWLNELVPSEPQENVLAVYEHILANTTQDLALTEDIVYYKANSDGKIMIERVPH